MGDRSQTVALRYLDCRESGMKHEQAIEYLSKLHCTGFGGAKSIEADLTKARRFCISIDEYEASPRLQRKHPEWKQWRGDFDRWCEEQVAKVDETLREFHTTPDSMSDDEFSELSEEAKKRLRGDFY